jgi:hypothetical protein
MWLITYDMISGAVSPQRREGTSSIDHVEGTSLPFRFRTLDEDGEVYFIGRSDEPTLDPLDWAMWDAGCTSIEYYNPSTKRWETL